MNNQTLEMEHLEFKNLSVSQMQSVTGGTDPIPYCVGQDYGRTARAIFDYLMLKAIPPLSWTGYFD